MSLWRKNSAKRLRVVRQISVYLKRRERRNMWRKHRHRLWLGEGGGERDRESETELGIEDAVAGSDSACSQ